MSGVWNRLVVEGEEPPPGELPRAAVLAPLYEDDRGDVRVIFIKRPMSMPTHAGHVAFPGGRPESEDDGPVETALREADEEVGIPPETVDVLGFLPSIHTVEYSLLVVPVVGRLPEEPELRPSPREVDRVFRPRLADLDDGTGWRHETWGDRTVWFHELDGDVLWGATAVMVRRLLGLGV